MSFGESNQQQLVILGDFEEALVGVCMDIEHNNAAVYSTQKILDILVWRDEMTPKGAFAYFEKFIFTELGAQGNPVFLKDLRDDE